MLIALSPWIIKTQYFSIHVYGFCIVIGLLIAFWNIINDQILQKHNLIEDSTKIIMYSIMSGWIGARLLWFYEYYNEISFVDFVTLTTPGFSLLGAVIGVLCAVCWGMKNVPASYRLILADRLALYGPLVIASGRIGCFFTGCCYGIETSAPWAVCYGHSDHLAPLDLMLHPVQLYSGGSLFILFLMLYVCRSKLKRGRLLFLSANGILIERFIVDFFRDDRTLVIGQMSLHQMVAISCLFSMYIIIITIFLSDYVQRKQR